MCVPNKLLDSLVAISLGTVYCTCHHKNVFSPPYMSSFGGHFRDRGYFLSNRTSTGWSNSTRMCVFLSRLPAKLIIAFLCLLCLCFFFLSIFSCLYVSVCQVRQSAPSSHPSFGRTQVVWLWQICLCQFSPSPQRESPQMDTCQVRMYNKCASWSQRLFS